MLAGFIGPSAGWRLPFVLVAVPALLFATLIALTVNEPVRGSKEEEVRSEMFRLRQIPEQQTFMENSKESTIRSLHCTR